MRTCKALVIGGSAGSLNILFKFLPSLSASLLFPIILVVHRKAGKEEMLTELLASKTQLKVKEAEEKETLEASTLYIAPPGYHLLMEKDRTLSLDASEKVNFSRPSIDVSFESAADTFEEGLVALLLSGANSDGTSGLQKVKERGGLTLVQDPESAQVSFMPQNAIDHAPIDHVLKPEQIAPLLNSLNDDSYGKI
ncbi:chemotaxis protein CheB [Chryseobacterium sp. A301]